MSETMGFDEQTRSLFSMEAFKDRENGTVLQQLYNYWITIPVGLQGLPREPDFNPGETFPPNVNDAISWIETKSEDPLKFIIREHAENTIPGLGVELSDKLLCDRPEIDMHTTACAVEFLFCKRERTPMYHEIEQILGGLKRHYTRLMLPVENNQGNVDRIYYTTRQIHPVKRITFHLVGAQ
jgi:hypothetical protein